MKMKVEYVLLCIGWGECAFCPNRHATFVFGWAVTL